MKNILLFLVGLFLLSTDVQAQSASTSPGTGHWVVIDSGYQVATTTTGQTVAPLYFYNTSTANNITGMQFKVKYDNTAFTKVVPSLKIATTSQVLSYTDDNTGGYLTVTLVYTGSSSTFNYSNGATFDLTFTHASSSVWNTLDSIKTLKVSNVAGWTDRAASSYGNDTTLTVYSYGGRFNQRVLRFVGMFFNTTGTKSSNLWVSLEKKPKTSSSWVTVRSNKTDANGKIVFREFLDTTYWDTRMVLKGDTMTVGNVYSTADAQKINQVMLGTYTPTGFDFYTFDANGADGTITIADVYSVYGRLAGRFTKWPNSQKDILFFTETQYKTINGSSTNYTSSITGATNFTYYINGKDSVVYYVAVKGDANNTGFKKARLTPIKIVNPANAKHYIIDETVTYEAALETIEINMPKVDVSDGNLVNIPVKVLTNGKTLGALQLDLKYDTALLEFKNIESTEKIMKWTSYFNPSNGMVSWGGADLTNSNLLKDGEQVITLQFIAKRPKDQWGTAAIWTGAKYVGDDQAKDMNITPAMGIVQVLKTKNGVHIQGLNNLISFPNPTDGQLFVQFEVKKDSDVNLDVKDLLGREIMHILDSKMPAGKYKYEVQLTNVSNGIYLLTLETKETINHNKIIVQK